ncbi:hypothetical protein Tco_0731469 [Tanacetum coccineum]
MVQDTPIEETVFMAIEVDESDDDLEEEDNQFGHHAFMFHPGPPTKIAEMVQLSEIDKPDKELPVKSKECEHEWSENTVTNYTICYFCGILTTDTSRLNCPQMPRFTTCSPLAKISLGQTKCNVKRKQPQKQEEEKDFNSNEVKLLKELLKEKTEQMQQMIRDQAKEYYQNKAAMQKKEEIKRLEELRTEKERLEEIRIEKEKLKEQKDEEIRELKAQCKKKEERISPFSKRVSTTGETTHDGIAINKRVIPEEALEPLTQTVVFNGLNSSQQATHKVKQGYFLIEESKFKIPLIYAFDMRDNNEIVELEVSEEEFLEINESIYFNQEGSRAFQEQFKPVINRLKQQDTGRRPINATGKRMDELKLAFINPRYYNRR